MHLVGDGEELLEPPHYNVLRWIGGLFVIVGKHLSTCVEQKQAEKSQHPLKTLYHRSSGEDEDTAQNEGSEDAPKQHLMLVFAVNPKEGEQHQEHKQVVHRQRLLYEVASEELHCLLVRLSRIEEIDTNTEE